MAILPWRTKRQLFYFGIFALIIIIIIGAIVWYFWPKPTCFDKRQNQGEEGIDCGGPCVPCLTEIRDISTLWSRFFKTRENYYDAAALIENPNLFGGLPSIKYQFKLYDANNVLIAVRDSQTFINPGEKQIIFESNIFTGPRVPKYVYIEFKKTDAWKYIKKEKSFLSVIKKDFVNLPFPRLTAEVRNESFFDVKNVFITAVLYDDEGNTQAVSSTKIDVIPPESVRSAFFTWPVPFSESPAAVEVIAATNLTL